MTSHRTRCLATGGLVAALILSGPPAGAAEERPLGGGSLAGRCTSAIDRRLSTLSQLADRARASAPLTDAHEAAVVAITTQQAQGLTSLRAEVLAAPTAAAQAEACGRVVPDHRVYVLTRPKVHLTIAADTVTAATSHLDRAVGALDQAAAAAEAAGGDVTGARAEIEAARAGSAAARDAVAGIADAVLPLEPDGYPANAAQLASSRARLNEARNELRSAARHGRDAHQLLRR